MDRIQLLQSLEAKGFSKEIVMAFSKVKRENFIPEGIKEHAYEDTPLSIGQGQTISQPYTISMMLKLLNVKKGQKVLEIGSGCGYVLALLSEMVGKKGEVFGIEIIEELAEKSRENIKGYKNVKVYNMNGKDGLKKHSPFDRILISAACAKIPKPALNQLKNKGIIVAPVGSRYEQALVAFKNEHREIKKIREIPGFIFVPFIE